MCIVCISGVMCISSIKCVENLQHLSDVCVSGDCTIHELPGDISSSLLEKVVKWEENPQMEFPPDNL